ncbi:extracellular mutant protein 11-domain-containing protein [Xylariomycetidae sp. FL0641]|nr:extracellular mutant protein 11-domain-containing protein [Xylariomycetidae sp. FL0641]
MPSTHFLKHSKTKMQAWVTNNGLSNSQPVTSTSEGPEVPPKHHLYQSQSALPEPAPHISPPRPRANGVNANANRAAAAMAARLPVPTRSTHTRDASTELHRAASVRPIHSEPIQTSTKRPLPFWEGSTIDGSVFSDTASYFDASTGTRSQQRMQLRAPVYQSRETPRPRPIVQEVKLEDRKDPVQDSHPPFVIRANGMMEVVGSPHARSVSTPDTRTRSMGLRELEPESEYNLDSEDNPSEPSPDRTPSARRQYHPRALTLRTNGRESFSERANHPKGDLPMVSPPKPRHTVERQDVAADEVRSQRSGHRIKLKVPDTHRSTIFADTDTPMDSHPAGSEASEVESIDRVPTPKPVPKAQPSVNRRLFDKNSKGQPSLHESAMARLPAEKRQHAPSRKRQYDLDYDDGALARMDFARLKQEDFDFDPAQAEARSVEEPPQGSLPEKLEHFLHKEKESQLDFFNKMPVNEWDEAGDWFLEKFGDVVAKLREARKAKRAMMQGYEEEIAARQEAVTNKMQGIGRTLADLKAEGQGMMQGKDLD